MNPTNGQTLTNNSSTHIVQIVLSQCGSNCIDRITWKKSFNIQETRNDSFILSMWQQHKWI